MKVGRIPQEKYDLSSLSLTGRNVSDIFFFVLFCMSKYSIRKTCAQGSSLQKCLFSPCCRPPLPRSLTWPIALAASQGAKAGRHLRQQGARKSFAKGLPGHVQQENQGLPLLLHAQREYVHLVPVRVSGLASVPVSTASGLRGQPSLVPLLVQNFLGEGEGGRERKMKETCFKGRYWRFTISIK